MPSPMDECDNITNIEPAPPTLDLTTLKRKSEVLEELALQFPVKSIAMATPTKSSVPSPIPEGTTPTQTSPRLKLTKTEKEALKAEKLKEKEAERLKKEQEKQKRIEERQQREEERLKKVA